MPLVDTLLRFAEAPRLYRPLWTAQIMAEVRKNLIGKFGMTPALALRREEQIKKAFPEAWVDGYEPFIEKNAERSEGPARLGSGGAIKLRVDHYV